MMLQPQAEEHTPRHTTIEQEYTASRHPSFPESTHSTTTAGSASSFVFITYTPRCSMWHNPRDKTTRMSGIQTISAPDTAGYATRNGTNGGHLMDSMGFALVRDRISNSSPATRL